MGRFSTRVKKRMGKCNVCGPRSLRIGGRGPLRRLLSVCGRELSDHHCSLIDVTFVVILSARITSLFSPLPLSVVNAIAGHPHSAPASAVSSSKVSVMASKGL